MSNIAGKYDFIATRGATFDVILLLKDSSKLPVPLHGFEVRMQIRTRAGIYGTTTDSTLLLEMNTPNGMISITDPSKGEISIVIPPSNSTILNPQNLGKVQHIYGIELFRMEGTKEYVIPLLEGTFSILGEIIR